MSNEQKHTPTPWHVGQGKAARIIYPVDGYAIADTKVFHGRYENPVEESEANAARIVHCVNNFDALTAERDRLREANGEMLEAIQWALDDAINGQISYVGKNKLRALIAKHSAHGQEKGG